MQLFAKGIDGSCRTLHLEGAEPKASDLWDCLKCEFSGIDESHCFVTCAGKVLRHADESLLAQGAGPGCTVQLSARLVGGKGGFGSLLRGLGRDGKVVDNFDACRDLTGRRLRHKEAEQKLAAWASDARERQLEKVATSFIKDMARKSQADAKAEFDVSSFREQQITAASGVKSALQSGLTEAAAHEKSRKRIAEERQEKLKKKAKLLGLEDLSDEEDDDDDDSEAEGGTKPSAD